MISQNKKVRFPLGQVVATRLALDALKENRQVALEFIARHANLDQGTLCEEDNQENQNAIANGGRIFSSYLLKDGTKVWVITEADRSSTCLLLPDEY